MRNVSRVAIIIIIVIMMTMTVKNKISAWGLTVEAGVMSHGVVELFVVG